MIWPPSTRQFECSVEALAPHQMVLLQSLLPWPLLPPAYELIRVALVQSLVVLRIHPPSCRRFRNLFHCPVDSIRLMCAVQRPPWFAPVTLLSLQVLTACRPQFSRLMVSHVFCHFPGKFLASEPASQAASQPARQPGSHSAGQPARQAARLSACALNLAVLLLDRPGLAIGDLIVQPNVDTSAP